MGSLTLPASGLVYTDTPILVYSVETHAKYWPLLKPLWQAARDGRFMLVSSELTTMEVLIGPLRKARTHGCRRPMSRCLRPPKCN